MKIGDKVLISPEVTHLSEWVSATVIQVEENPYVGTVISAETGDGDIFFSYACHFRSV